MFLILLLISQLQIDIEGVRADIVEARYDYNDNPRVLYVTLDEIFKNGFE